MNSAFETNCNNTVPLPNNLGKYIEEVIEFRLNNTLLYRVQSVTCDEAAVLLSVDTDTIREWIKAGKLLASKPGREWIIRVMDIDRMLTTHATLISISDKRFKRNRNAS